MARKKNLERAIVLGLLLSVSVYGNAWAMPIEDFRNSADATGNIIVDEDTIVDGNSTYSGGDGNSNSLDNKTITVSNGSDLTLKNVHMLKPNIVGDGDIIIRITDKNANTAGIHVSGNITANSLTIDTSETGTVKGINAHGDVAITANKVDIKAADHGIFLTDEVSSANVTINAGESVRIEGGSRWGLQSEGSNKNISIMSDNTNSKIIIASKSSGGITNNSSTGYTYLEAGSIDVNTSHYYAVIGTYGDITLKATNGDINIQGGQAGLRNEYGKVESLADYGSNNISLVEMGTMGGVQSDSGATAEMIVRARDYNRIYADEFGSGIYSRGDNTMTVTAGIDNIITGTTGIKSTGTGILNVTADGDNIIGVVGTEEQDGYIGEIGIGITNGTVNLSAQNNYITANSIGVSVNGNGSIATLDANNNYISAVNEESGDATGIEVEDGATLNLSKKDGYVTENVVVEAIADNGNATGISLNNSALVTDPALKNLTISSISKNADNKTATGVNLENNSNFNAHADDISILAGKDSSIYGSGKAISALGDSTVTLNANNITLGGAVYAEGSKTSVELSGLNNGNAVNDVYSAAVIDKAGDLDGKEIIENGDGTVTTTGMDVVSALYAEKGASINLSGVNNIQTYYDDPSDTHTSERAVWAYQGANITIGGTTNISTSNYEISPENRDIAIAAGTATKLDESDFTDYGKVEIANVNLNYKAGSSINGDILAAYGGVVNITDTNAVGRDVNGGAETGIAITGDLLAGNKGKLTVDLGNNGVLIGRADDYGDAELNNGHGSGDENGFYNPAFSSNILHGGEVTLNMGNGSQWSVQGQSWITNLNTKGNVLIDLTNASTEYESNAHALTVRNLNGDANIKMSLNGDRTQSDMLYIGKGIGTYNIELDEVVDIDDMYADSGEGFKFTGLRFATVGKGSDVDFNVTATDKGFNNIIYTVGKDVYGSNVSNHENDAYNNGYGTSLDKPGNAAVEDLLKDAEQAGAATINTNDIMLLANEPDTGENLDNNENHLNYKLIDMQTVRSDAGETMLNMSRANYSNAIYMDRLNKRLGEARYINDDPEEDEGMWVRVRHDRIGKDEAFRSQNTMYELGYDKRQECDNGKRRVGFAVDYMHGDTGYNDIAGKGEIDRYGLWLYDTWTGNKGHYVDYVAKWGHLSNDFEVYNSEGKVTGDYSNNVFSISAEYGRKKDMGNDWYFEPQAQLQLARVTGADYTTSQSTKVSVDGINSLIGRAGFRIGKDFGEEKQSTVYLKADVLHEFLGDQDIRAFDGTTSGWQTVSYENEGTWYDVGLGFAAMMSKSSYAFLDLERSFGHDNDETYQINVGMQWSF